MHLKIEIIPTVDINIFSEQSAAYLLYIVEKIFTKIYTKILL